MPFSHSYTDASLAEFFLFSFVYIFVILKA